MKTPSQTALVVRLFGVACLFFWLGSVAQAGGFQSFPPYATNSILKELPSFRTYTDKDGLPQNLVQAIALDTYGYLWVGTQNGAAFYNGRSWIAVNIPNKASNLVNQNAILAASDGSIWFGTRDGGVSRLLNGTWTTFNSRNGLAGNNVNCILETKSREGSSSIWVGTYGGGISRFQNGQWTTLDKPSGVSNNKVLCLIETKAANGDSVLWVGTDGGGLSRYQAGQWTNFNKSSGLPDNKVWCVLETKDTVGNATLWVGTEEGGLACCQEGHWTTINKASGLPSDSVYSLAETYYQDGSHILWVGTMGGGLARLELDQEPGRGSELEGEKAKRRKGEKETTLQPKQFDGNSLENRKSQITNGKSEEILNSSRWSYFTIETGLPSNLVRSLFSTSVGNKHTLWIGTDGGGITRLEYTPWRPFQTPSGILKNKVQCLLETVDAQGQPTLWISTVGDGLLKFQNDTWTLLTEKSGLPSNKVRCLLETKDKDGSTNLWVGTNNGLGQFRNGKWTIFNSSSGLADEVVFCLLETKDEEQNSTLWVGTGGGLSRFQNGQWTTFTTKSGLIHNSVRTLLETKDIGSSALWVGTLGGLSCFQKNHWTSFDTSSGLANNYVRCLLKTTTENNEPTLCIGTDGGLSCFDMRKHTWFSLSDKTTPALPNNVINHMCQDLKGRIYLLTIKGIVRLEMPTSMSGKCEMYTFTTEDGLPSNECSGTTGFTDRQGRIWAGTIKGVTVFDPKREIPDHTPKPLYIEHLSVVKKESRGSDRVFPLSPNASLRHNENQLVFDFALLSYFRESDTRYRTQLAGFDEVPSEWTTDNNKEYSNLEAGWYVFKVWGKDYAGNITGPVEVYFSVRPAPWRTWWAYGLYFLIGIAVLYSGVQLRFRTLRRRTANLKKAVAERTAEVVEREHRLELANQELETTNSELKKLNELKSEFLSIAAHDLKNPLTIIMTFSELIGLQMEKNPEIISMTQAMFTSSQRMLAIINGLLDTAALDNKKLKLSKKPVCLRSLAELVIASNQTQAGAKQIIITFQANPDTNFTAEVDEARIEAVFDNLVSNAIKYSPFQKRVWVSLYKEGEQIRFEVKDEGPGLTEDDKQKLFGKFQRLSAKPTGGESSTGLGLSIVQQLVELHGGRVWAESEPGEGATFLVEIPT